MREAVGKDQTLLSEPETKSEFLPLPMPGDPSDETTALAVSSYKLREPDPHCHSHCKPFLGPAHLDVLNRQTT